MNLPFFTRGFSRLGSRTTADTRPAPRTLDADRAPGLGEALLVTLISVIVMVGLYSGLDGRNARLVAEGHTLFQPLTSLDVRLPLVPGLTWIYYTYFPLTLSLHVITYRSRARLYEAFAGYLVLACTGFLFFYFLPSRMIQPSLATCDSASCRALDVMYRSDDGFNAFPSMHVAYSVYVALFFRDHLRKWSPIPIALAAGIALSTVLCKRHFVVDVPAGATLALASRPVAKAAASFVARWRVAR